MMLTVLLLLVLLTPAWGKTIFVAQSGGNDGNSCTAATNSATPKLTLGGGLGCLAGGDTLQLGAGTYTDTNLLNNIPSGSAGAPTILQPIAGQTAVIQPFNCDPGGILFLSQGQGYITFQGPGLVFDGGNCSGLSQYGVQIKDAIHHLVFQDMELRNTQGVGFAFGGGEPPDIPNNVRLTRMSIHHIGTNTSGLNPPGAYCIYLNGQQSIIEDSQIYDCLSAWGIHGYAAGNRFNDHMIIRNNWIHHTNINHDDPNGAGGILFWAHNGSQNQIYNNVVSSCNNNMAAIYLSEGSAGGNLFVNNTIYGCTGGGSGMRVAGTSGWSIQNNIWFGNSQNNITYDDGQGSTVENHNLKGTDPMFVNAGANDFHLQAGSPAIDTGVCVSGVAVDKDHVARPQPVGGNCDIGAYEGSGILPSVPSITSSLSASGQVGTAFSYQITATNSPTSYNATGLPSGLSVSTSTGGISGTPAAAGTSSVTLSATNASGTGNATLTLTIAATATLTPIAWWKFDEGTGTTAADATLNGQTLTLTAGPTWQPGRVGPFSLHCDGTGGYAQKTIPFDTSTQQYTFTAWIKGDAAPPTTNQHVVMNGLTSEPWGLSWGHGDPLFRQAWQHRDSSGNYLAAQLTTALVGGVWYHIAATYDGSNVRAYLNGALQATTAVSSIIAASGAFTLCGSGVVTPFAGNVDQGKVWNRALSGAEIAQEYNAAAAAGVRQHKIVQQ